MDSRVLILYLSLFIASIPSYQCAANKQLSTVFVLETSDLSTQTDAFSPGDSTSQSSELKARSLDDSSSTRIITDDAQQQPAAKHSSQNTSNSHQHSSYSSGQPQQTSQHSSIPNQPVSSSTNRENAPHHSVATSTNSASSPTSRKLEEESQVISNSNHKLSALPTRNINNQQVSSATSHNNNQHSHQHKQQQTRPTTSSSIEDSNLSTPKTEERLLISITSNEDEDFKPPMKQNPSNLGINNDNDELTSQHQQQHQHQKRKPSITISIQDANLKQNGGSGQAVIVRPSENGQSIVISTVSASGVPTNNGGSNHAIKPVAIIPSSNNDREPPYREPVNIPVATINNNNNHHNNNNHYASSSTHRPSLIGNDHLNPNRPITSTLIDQPQRPHQITDERPQRPSSVSVNDDLSPSNSNYESRPTPRPSISTSSNDQSSSNYGGDHDDSTRPTNGIGSSNNQQSGESKYPLNEKNCGLVHETRIVGGEEANPDDFLWMAAIIKSRPKDGEARPFCGGSLITRRHILTAAHCLENLAPRDVLVRLGSYDFDDSTASSLSADYAIDQFRVPAQYSKKTHVADIAIMRLKTPLSLSDNYKTVCMPQPRRSYVGALGTVTGYGSQSQTFRRAAPKLRQVTVPIWENRKCSSIYKKSLNESFLCAGYEEGGKDACQGDSGGPLMTDGPNERMMIVGVVSHGIGCGGNYPGVYTRTTTFLDWIEKNTRE